MCEAAMMRKAVDRPLKFRKHVEVRCFGGQRHGGGCERGLAIESSSRENSARQEMSDRFQTDFVSQKQGVIRCTSSATAVPKAVYERDEVTRRLFKHFLCEPSWSSCFTGRGT